MARLEATMVSPGWIGLVITLAVQGSAAIWWGSGIENRLRAIETRGSIQAAEATARITMMEYRFKQIEERSEDRANNPVASARLDQRVLSLENNMNLIQRSLLSQWRDLRKIMPPEKAEPESGAWRP